MTEQCPICGTQFELYDILNYSTLCDEEGEVYGQESACPECGEEMWIPSWEIEELMEAKPQ